MAAGPNGALTCDSMDSRYGNAGARRTVSPHVLGRNNVCRPASAPMRKWPGVWNHGVVLCHLWGLRACTCSPSQFLDSNFSHA